MRRNNTIANLDWIVVILYLFLVLTGWLNIYSVGFNDEYSGILNLDQRYGKQLLWIIFSCILAMAILVIDSKFFVTFSYVIYAFLILMLLVVLGVATEVNGAKSWFVVGSFSIQPAEFAKYGTALAVSKLISTYNFSFTNRRNQFMLAALVLLPISLIVLQNDVGSAMVYVVFLFPFFREGMSGLILFFGIYLAILFISSLVLAPITFIIALILLALLVALFFRVNILDILKGILVLVIASIPFLVYQWIAKGSAINLQFILTWGTALAALVLLIRSVIKRIPYIPLITSVLLSSVVFSVSVDYLFNNLLKEYQRKRVKVMLGLESDPYGYEYHVKQSKIAIGSGGFSGKGFLEGTQTKFKFVPEQSTDFIFCTVGEEWGFLGSATVLFTFMFLLIRIVQLAERQRSVYSRVYGYSVAAIIFFHVTVNIGMTIGMTPVIGIPLPFYSYGGSSLWFFTILLFTFLRLDTSRLEQLH